VSEAAVDVRGLCVDLGGTRVLDRVDLRIEPGSFVALVGPNGAGKTTLLRTVNGLVDPAGGRVLVDGTDATGLSARELARRVATVPQEPTLGFDFPVRDVVAMGRTPHRSRFAGTTDEDRRAVERALDRTALTGLADRPVGDLSGGERRRVLLARALAQAAPTLLLDEPTANLDVNHQVRSLGLVRELVDEGQTAVTAVHDLDLAARFCDRMAVLADGKILDSGPPAAVLTEDVIETAFGVRARITEDPATGTPRVTALDATR